MEAKAEQQALPSHRSSSVGSSVSKRRRQGKRVAVYVNGRGTECRVVRVPTTLDGLVRDCGAKLGFDASVLYNRDGRRITSLTEVADGDVIAVAGSEPFVSSLPLNVALQGERALKVTTGLSASQRLSEYSTGRSESNRPTEKDSTHRTHATGILTSTSERKEHETYRTNDGVSTGAGFPTKRSAAASSKPPLSRRSAATDGHGVVLMKKGASVGRSTPQSMVSEEEVQPRRAMSAGANHDDAKENEANPVRNTTRKRSTKMAARESRNILVRRASESSQKMIAALREQIGEDDPNPEFLRTAYDEKREILGKLKAKAKNEAGFPTYLRKTPRIPPRRSTSPTASTRARAKEFADEAMVHNKIYGIGTSGAGDIKRLFRTYHRKMCEGVETPKLDLARASTADAERQKERRFKYFVREAKTMLAGTKAVPMRYYDLPDTNITVAEEDRPKRVRPKKAHYADSSELWERINPAFFSSKDLMLTTTQFDDKLREGAPPARRPITHGIVCGPETKFLHESKRTDHSLPIDRKTSIVFV